MTRKHSVKFYQELRDSCSDFNEYVRALFWLNVEPGSSQECWGWRGNVGTGGYGRLSVRCYGKGKIKILPTHKLSWWIYTGKYVRKPLCVCHQCDNPPCCNPNHLFVGTTQDNAADRDRKNRQIKGSDQWNSKLTEKVVEQIRKLNQVGWYTHQIAKNLGLSDQIVNDALHGKTWKHVPSVISPVNYKFGEKHYHAKLTEVQVIKIRKEYSQGQISQRELAEEYGVAQMTISRVVRCKIWNHI